MSSSAFFFLKAQFMYHEFLWTLTTAPETGACDVGNRQSWAEIAARWGDGGSLRLKLTGRPVQGGQQRADVERSPGLASEVPGASKTWRRSQNKRQSELVPWRVPSAPPASSRGFRASAGVAPSLYLPREHTWAERGSQEIFGALDIPPGPNHSEPMAARQNGRGLPPRDQEERQPDGKVGNSSNERPFTVC